MAIVRFVDQCFGCSASFRWLCGDSPTRSTSICLGLQTGPGATWVEGRSLTAAACLPEQCRLQSGQTFNIAGANGGNNAWFASVAANNNPGTVSLVVPVNVANVVECLYTPEHDVGSERNFLRHNHFHRFRRRKLLRRSDGQLRHPRLQPIHLDQFDQFDGTQFLGLEQRSSRRLAAPG